MITRIVEAFGNPHEPYANLSPVVGLVFSCSILWAIFDHFHSDFHNPRNAIAEAFISYLVHRNSIFAALLDPESLRRPCVQPDYSVHAGRNVSLLQHGYLDQRGLWRNRAAEPFVRIVAALESMSGIFFVAVVVARLVSSYRPKTAQQRQSLAHEAGASEMQSNCECGRVEAVTTLASY